MADLARDSVLQSPSNDSMAGESDADLLVYVGMAADCPAEAQAAFIEFHGRHAGILFEWCKKNFGRRLPHYYSVEDLVGDTLARIWERAGTFDSASLKDTDQIRRLARCWMFAIAKNILQDVYRGRPTIEKTLSPEYLDEQPSPEPPEDTPAVHVVQEAMQAVLDDRERTVLTTKYVWYRPGEAHQRLPNDVAQDLAKQLGTTSDNLRKIHARALLKVKSYLLDHEIESLLKQDIVS